MADTASAPAPAKTPEQISEENNLLPKLITHLDRHLIFPLLQFVAEQQEDEEDSQEITKAKYELLKTTNMTDYVASLYTEINDVAEPPKEFGAKRQAVLERLDQFEQESAAITDLLGREDVITNLRADKVANLEYLKKEHEVCLAPRTFFPSPDIFLDEFTDAWKIGHPRDGRRALRFR